MVPSLGVVSDVHPGDGPVPDCYLLRDSAPSEADYLHLRAASGLKPRTAEQAARALPGSWAACHVIRASDDLCVAMGRVIGDGGCCFHVVDMAVLPDHQRRGLGDLVLTYLLDVVRREAAPGANVTLMADPPGRRLYGRHGFVDSAPTSVGMTVTLAPSGSDGRTGHSPG